MCGITGLLADGAGVSELSVRGMAAALRHRGPDDEGVWCDAAAGVGLGHARLAVLDISCAGHQPMVSANGRHVIAFNGEIYNHLEIRAAVELAGWAPAWRGHSDTETMLAGFDVWGVEATIKKSVGMFAFAVWDRESCILTLGRDRLGEKPLFYGWQGETFFFGSELKSLRAHQNFKAEINRDAVATLMRYGYIPGPQSIYRGIQKLPPGTLLNVRPGARDPATPASYWSLVETARQGLQTPFAGSDEEALEGLAARLSKAVALQQVADVPLGAFLSGGIDSSTIVALMQAGSTRPVQSFTIGWDDRQYDEARHARAVARHLRTDHTDLYVTPEEARALIPRLPTLYDEPFADPSQVPTFLVSQLARRTVTVSLSGDAGDELFGGYNRYAWMRRLLRVPAALRRVLSAGLGALNPSQWDCAYAAMRPILPASLRFRAPGDKAHKLAPVLAIQSDAGMYARLISTWSDPDQVVVAGHDVSDMSRAWEELADFDSPEHRMMVLDALTYLPDDILCKVDRAAMGVSLETRLPFLDHRVVEYAWQLPLHMKFRDGQSKWILRRLLDRYVPENLIERPKMGFGVPIDSWLRGPLRDWAEELLDATRLRQEGYLNPGPIRKRWTEHLSGRRNWQYQLWVVLMFQAWLASQDA